MVSHVENKPAKAELLLEFMRSNQIREAKILQRKVVITFEDGGRLEMSLNMYKGHDEQRHTA